MIKPLIDQFVLENPNTKCKKLTEWSRNTHVGLSLHVPIIKILGSSEIKGSYFHPSIVS